MSIFSILVSSLVVCAVAAPFATGTKMSLWQRLFGKKRRRRVAALPDWRVEADRILDHVNTPRGADR